MNKTHDPEDEFDQMLQKSLEQDYKAMKERDKQAYDGVVGLPPRWVPEWAVSFFRGYRNRLLDVREYTHKDLLALINQYDEIENNPAGFRWAAVYPNGRSIDLYCFQDEIRFLSWLRWCVGQGKEKGLEILGGGFAVSGMKAAASLEKATNAKNAPARESKEFCISIAKSIWDVQVERKDEEIDRMGEMVKTLLEYLKKENHFLPKNKETVSKWLKEAEKEGKLNIPPEASKSGAPKK